MSTPERLQKYLARSGVSSRRGGEQLIEEGRVQVNGKVVQELGTKVSLEDVVVVDGRRISPEKLVLYLMYKPRGVVTTLSDPQRRECVGDLVQGLAGSVFPVGRLDRDVSGLLLLTNDGAFAESLLHPRYEIPRTYWAIVEGVVDRGVLLDLKQGVSLDGGRAKVQNVEFLKSSRRVKQILGLSTSEETLLELTVGEGRKHFVKRILGKVGHPVRVLSRVRFGSYQLGDLEEGEIRETTFP